MTDGLRGSDNHRDGIWQGWWDEDLVATIDLGSVQSIQSVSLSFINNEGAWILPSESLAAFVSSDGDVWVEDDGIQLTEYPGGTEAKRVNVFLTFQNEEQSPEARFIRLEAARAPLPEGHPGAGHSGWLFVDEIVVR